jgi:hypothetical protein
LTFGLRRAFWPIGLIFYHHNRLYLWLKTSDLWVDWLFELEKPSSHFGNGEGSDNWVLSETTVLSSFAREEFQAVPSLRTGVAHQLVLLDGVKPFNRFPEEAICR